AGGSRIRLVRERTRADRVDGQHLVEVLLTVGEAGVGVGGRSDRGRRGGDLRLRARGRRAVDLVLEDGRAAIGGRSAPGERDGGVAGGGPESGGRAGDGCAAAEGAGTEVVGTTGRATHADSHVAGGAVCRVGDAPEPRPGRAALMPRLEGRAFDTQEVDIAGDQLLVHALAGGEGVVVA